MNNPFNDMKDEEFLYKICAFMGKENFIRFVDIIGGTTGKDKCGQYFYEFLGKYEKENYL